MMVDKKPAYELSTLEKRVLLTLDKCDGSASPENLVKKGNFDKQVEVMNASSWLQSKKLVTIETHIQKEYSLDKDGQRYLKEGFPERRALQFLIDHNGVASISQLSSVLARHEIPIAIGWMKRNKWATIEKGKETILSVTKIGKQAIDKKTDQEKIIHQLNTAPQENIPNQLLQQLVSRKNVIKEKERVTNTIQITDQGKHLVKQGIEIKEELSQLTSAIIKSGAWKNKSIRPYDINAFAPTIHGGKPHPLIGLIQEIREIFVEMGFEEIQGDYVDSTFWCMDVLFIPQDHPAREMQDTFYCQHPDKREIQEEQLLKNVASIHENGGDTGSKGWGGTFSKKASMQPLLRTHTTINTIRYLYHHQQPPCKVFSIGRVFRKERIDSTHLPEFHQIEGIIHEQGVTFRQLIGMLKEFYKRMGFEKIRCRPGYFPYTEPSMEIDVFWHGKWMELGGSGIFRPEVTNAVGVTNPVLAWGLGLERLAMLRFGLSDLRDLYISDLEWLQHTPVFIKSNSKQ